MRKQFVIFLSIFLFPILISAQSNWIIQNPIYPSNLSDAVFIDSQTGYIAGDRFFIAKTTNAGVNWEFKNSSITDTFNVLNPIKLNFFTTEEGFAYTGRLFYTSNGGTSWVLKSNNYFGSLYFVNSHIGFGNLNSDPKKLIKTQDGGSNWFVSYTFEKNIKEIKFVNINSGFVSTQFADSCICYKTTDGGNTFLIAFATSQNDYLKDFKFINDSTGFAFIDAKFYETKNLGTSWTLLKDFGAQIKKNISRNNNFIGVTCNNYNSNSYFQSISLNSGLEWSERLIPLSGNMIYLDNSNGYVFGNIGVTFLTTNQGMTFSNVSSKFALTDSLVKVQVFSNNNIIALKSTRGSKFIVSTSNAGINWNKIGLDYTYLEGNFTDMNTGYLNVGTKIIKTTNEGYNWTNINFNIYNIGISDLIFVNNLTGYANFKIGGLAYDLSYKKTTNGGLTWQEIRKGFYNPIGGNYVYYEKYYNMVEYNNEVWSVFKHYFYYFSTHLKDIYSVEMTTNSGTNWVNWTFPENVIPYYIDVVGNKSYLSTNFGFYKSTNQGANWVIMSNFTCSKFKFVTDSCAYALTKDGSIYKTTNTGWNWIRLLDKSYVTDFDFLDNSFGYVVGAGGFIAKTIDGGGSTEIQNPNAIFIKEYTISQNYPNPFNPSTNIKFSIPESGLVQIKIFDMLGREVQTLLNEFKTPGEYNVNFNGSSLSSGVYFYKLITNEFVETKKMMLIK